MIINTLIILSGLITPPVVVQSQVFYHSDNSFIQSNYYYRPEDECLFQQIMEVEASFFIVKENLPPVRITNVILPYNILITYEHTTNFLNIKHLSE